MLSSVCGVSGNGKRFKTKCAPRELGADVTQPCRHLGTSQRNASSPAAPVTPFSTAVRRSVQRRAAHWLDDLARTGGQLPLLRAKNAWGRTSRPSIRRNGVVPRLQERCLCVVPPWFSQFPASYFMEEPHSGYSAWQIPATIFFIK
jgi:hypothetical protein